MERKLVQKFFLHLSEQPLRFIVMLSLYGAFLRPKGFRVTDVNPKNWTAAAQHILGTLLGGSRPEVRGIKAIFDFLAWRYTGFLR